MPFTSPDNIDTSKRSLMVQEDTGNALIWQHRLQQSDWRVVASVNDPGGESSGIVDASQFFGPGSWLLDVQAHSTDVAFDKVGARHPDPTGGRAAHAARAPGLVTTNPRHGMLLAGIPEPPKTFGRPT